MITDAELLKLVMDRYPEQNTQFIIDQFTVLKAGIIQANNKLAVRDPNSSEPLEIQVSEPEVAPAEEQPVEQETPKKKYSRRDLKVKPAESITDKSIRCCLCGREFSSLTSRHLATHDITVEDYKKLCGFGPEQPLMSKEQYVKMKKNIEKALAAKNRVIR